MRKTATIITSLVLLAGLTACSGGSNNPAPSDCQPAAQPGSSSETITATGTLDTPPKVRFPTPLHPSETERSVLIPGEGITAGMGQKVVIELNVYNGSTGAAIESSKYDEQSPASFVLTKDGLPGLTKSLECAQAGSRIASAVPPADAFGPAGGNPQIGVGAHDSLVFVMDVKQVFPARADGKPQAAQPGFPSVVLAENGQPGITIPPINAPTELKVTALKVGAGPEVKKGDSVTVQYTGVLWDTGKVFDSSWEKGQPATFVTDQVVPGFADALIGHTVGSQMLAVIPPDQGYGDKAQGAIPANSTLVFVVDILGIG